MKSSYSSNNFGQWACSSCAYDLTDVRARVANHSANISSLNQKLNLNRGLEIYKIVRGEVKN